MGVTGSPTMLNMASEKGKLAARDWIPVVEEVFICGSVRRRCDVVRDVDLLLVTDRPQLTDLPQPPGWHVTAKQANRWLQGVRMEGFWCPTDCIGPGLVFLTGPGDLNVFMRRQALRRGMTLSQYGLRRKSAEKDRVDDNTEEGVFGMLDLPYLHPWERQTWQEEFARLGVEGTG